MEQVWDDETKAQYKIKWEGQQEDGEEKTVELVLHHEQEERKERVENVQQELGNM